MVMPMGIEGTSSRLEFSSVQKKRECIALPLFNVLGKSQLLEALIKYDRLLACRRFGHATTTTGEQPVVLNKSFLYWSEPKQLND